MPRANMARWLAILLVDPVYGYDYDPSDFATEVVEYVEGGGVPKDAVTGVRFNNPLAALGRPTIDTTGDGLYTGPPTKAVPVVQVSQAFRCFELVSIGEGTSEGPGRLVLKF